jgi:hypothetical protein
LNRTSHISETQRPELREELTRNLRGQADHSLLQWFGRNKMLAEQARVLRQALVENEGAGMPRPGALPGDPRALRGIPAIGGFGSVGGAIAGSRPGDSLTGRRGEAILRGIRERARDRQVLPRDEPPPELDKLP